MSNQIPGNPNMNDEARTRLDLNKAEQFERQIAQQGNSATDRAPFVHGTNTGSHKRWIHRDQPGSRK